MQITFGFGKDVLGVAVFFGGSVWRDAVNGVRWGLLKWAFILGSKSRCSEAIPSVTFPMFAGLVT